MTPTQRIEVRMSERRQRIGELLALDECDAEQRAELDTLTKGLQGDEVELRAAKLVETTETQRIEADHGDAGKLEGRAELRAACSLSNFVAAALAGRAPTGAEGEYATEVGLSTGHIPLDMFDSPPEGRAEHRNLSEAPSTVGVNLDPIVPMVFTRAVSPRLGIDMPRVESGTYATGTITTGLTAAARNKSGTDSEAEATAAAITVQTTTPHRVSARMSIALEDIASIGTDNFESALRQNLSLALSAQLDEFTLRGDGTAPNPTGLLGRFASASASQNVTSWGGFVSAVAGGIDGGPWAESMTDVRLLVNAETMRLAETTFQAGSGTDTPGEMSAAAYLRAHSGGFMSSSRMPATDSNVAQAIRYRPGTMGLDGVDAVRTAVCPVWSQVAIDDISTDSASGHRHVTFHVLIGDVIIVQADAYERVDLTVSA